VVVVGTPFHFNFKWTPLGWCGRIYVIFQPSFLFWMIGVVCLGE